MVAGVGQERQSDGSANESFHSKTSRETRVRERDERTSGRSANTQHDAEKDDPKKDDRQRAAQRKFGAVIRPVAHQAQVAFARSGLTLPQLVLERICEFQIDETRHFSMQLRSTVRVPESEGGSVWDEYVRGRLVPDRADRIEGVHDAAGQPVFMMRRPAVGQTKNRAPGGEA